MAMPASRFVGLVRAYKDCGLVPAGGSAIHQPLRSAGLFAADFADRVQFHHVFCERHEKRHEPERLAAEILVQACDDHLDATIGKPLAQGHDAVIEKLDLFDRYKLRVGGEAALDGATVGDGGGCE